MIAQKDLLEIWKERISKEGKRGDKAKVYKRVPTTAPTYAEGIKKEKYTDLTEGEMKAIEGHIAILDERIKEEQKKRMQYATN